MLKKQQKVKITNNMKIKKFNEKDMLGIKKLDFKLFSDLQDYIKVFKLSKTQMPIIFLCEEKNRLVGIIVGIIYETAERIKQGSIENLFVSKSRRRQGIGKELLNKLEKEFRKRGVKKIVATIEYKRKNNPKQFYLSCGYSKTSLGGLLEKEL